MEDHEYLDGKVEAIRNPEGLWINSQVFREEGAHYMKYKRYCSDPAGSPAWFDYWLEQKRRCVKGYSVGGARITGEHYFYLNFCPIKKVEDTNASKSRKIKGFPDFWDGDYNYFWVREIARQGVFDAMHPGEEEQEAFIELDSEGQALELKALFESLHLEVRIEVDYLRGGWNLIVGKSRRKGYSFKNASIAACNYFTKPHELTILNAYEKKYLYPKGTMTMAVDHINFVNDNTGWTMPSDVINRTDHIRASYIQYKNGIRLEKGFMSEIMAITCKDNADVNRGKDALDIFVEEAGAMGIPGLLKDLYAASEDCVMAGAIKTGLITVFGTSGDMGGGTADYADMHTRPLSFGMLPFNNIWDPNSEDHKVGFFHPINLNMEGYYDTQGNSDKEGAKKAELKIRKDLIKNGASSVELQKRLQEKPLGPAEAFSAVSINNFPVVELQRRLRIVKSKNIQKVKGSPIEMSYEKGKVVVKPILDGKDNAITSLDNLPIDKRGCPVIYEQPIGDAPPGLYKIGYDPVRQDEGSSLAAIIVYKSVHKNQTSKLKIVAEYVGRLETPDDIDRLSLMFADYYNGQVMHENEVTSVKNWFRRQKRLDRLAMQPDAVISKNIKKSKVARVYGCHMNIQLKDAGERYTKQWLLTVIDHDENGDAITVIDQIDSQRLLEELINYNRKGNFDLVSALFMCLIQAEEEVLDKEYGEKEKSKTAKELLGLYDEMSHEIQGILD